MNYFKTNEELSYILDENGTGISWASFGFTVRDVSKAISQGFQQYDEGKLVSMLPISNEEIFQGTLGKILNTPDCNPYFLVISEKEAIQERDRLKAKNQALIDDTPLTQVEMSVSEKIDLLIETQADMIGGTL